MIFVIRPPNINLSIKFWILYPPLPSKMTIFLKIGGGADDNAYYGINIIL